MNATTGEKHGGGPLIILWINTALHIYICPILCLYVFYILLY